MATWTETLHGVIDLDTGIGMEPEGSGSSWSVVAYSLAGGSSASPTTIKYPFSSIEDATAWIRTFTGPGVVVP